MTQPVFEWYLDKNGRYRFRLKTGDGKILLISDSFDSKAELKNAIEKFKKTVPKSETREISLQEVAQDVKHIKETQVRQEKESNASFYFGIVLGGLIGVIGNFFVSYWVMPSTNTLGLAISGALLVIMFIALFIQARKYLRERST